MSVSRPLILSVHKASREAGRGRATWYLKILPLHHKQYGGELHPKLTDTTGSPAQQKHLTIICGLTGLVIPSLAPLQAHRLGEGDSHV